MIYRIDLAYDGASFRGWARNRGVRTVQETLETAMTTVLGVGVDLTVAGRTDAGVHARHQVASFSSDADIDTAALVRSLRSMLAPEISVQSLQVAADGFDARFSAVARSYRYFIEEAPAHDPLRVQTWHVGVSLDIDSMNLAASNFVGERDFASLCRAAEGRTTERTVSEAAWERETAAGGLLVYRVTARAFCHQMVRSMVRLCADVGRGKIAADTVPAILDARDRNASRGGVAPPHGLVLWAVEYPAG